MRSAMRRAGPAPSRCSHRRPSRTRNWWSMRYSVPVSVGRRGLPLIAVDVPSGVMGDTGESCGAVAAHCTVTFARKKPCHVLLPGRDLAGDVVVADIGTPSSVLDGITVDMWENDPALWRRELPRAASGGNKY